MICLDVICCDLCRHLFTIFGGKTHLVNKIIDKYFGFHLNLIQFKQNMNVFEEKVMDWSQQQFNMKIQSKDTFK